MNKLPVVSVVMITYKHEAFIAQAIEGVLMQEVKFPVELIIADDCSPDKTKFVVESFKKHKNYNWIKYTRHQTNKGMMANFMWALQQSKGKYIALCEGDDYWTDPYKLQKQVDFLEFNEGYVLCFHKIFTIYLDGVKKESSSPPQNYEQIETLAFWGNYIHTLSVVFRNEIKKFPNEMEKVPIGDYFLFILLAQKGKIGYITDNMGVYRSGIGIYSSKKLIQKEIMWVKTLILVIKNIEEMKIRYIVEDKIFESIQRIDKLVNNGSGEIKFKIIRDRILWKIASYLKRLNIKYKFNI